MLLNFRFANLRSFHNETLFSLQASPQRTLNDNLIRNYDLRILPSTVIYGANASGKSNFILALNIMREIILAGSTEADSLLLKNLELLPFVHDPDNRPIHFSLDFINGDERYEYSFDLAVKAFERGPRTIHSEILYRIAKNGKRTEIFHRKQRIVKLNNDPRLLKAYGINDATLLVLEKRINDNLDETELFLSRAFKSTISNEIADQVIDFFADQLLVMPDFSKLTSQILLSDAQELESDSFMWNDIFDGFTKQADFGPQLLRFHLKKTNEQVPQNMELISIYNCSNRHVVIPAALMESRGTLKLMDFLIPFIDYFEKGGVLVLDEFDTSIHPELVKGIVAVFNNPELNKAGAQIIFTTHNPLYLNNRFFRRDQIFFIEKDEDSYESTLYNLADFGSDTVRNDHNYMINYFKGEYGALPFLDFSSLFQSQHVNGEQDD